MATRKKKAATAQTLGDRLRQTRLERNWTQEQLAAKAGTTQAVIQKIENGKSLRPRRLDKIAKALGASPSWLMFGTESVGEVSSEAMEVARAWSKLREPARSAMREAIVKMIPGGRRAG